ncbi:MAG: hypothetical protein KDG89_08515 [Geminicoccaceae bacterium]|nr:hypothetical protein [Geminicoccaceae bacterium]
MIESLLHRIERLERSAGTAGEALGPSPNDAASIDGAAPAERALERTLTRNGALLLLQGRFDIEPALAYTHSRTSGPVFLAEGNASVVSIGEDAVDRDEVKVGLDLRTGLLGDAQVEANLP